jgi:transcriptional regulator with XRE-family HTH domain
MRGERSLREVERDTGIANSRLCNIERGSQQPGLKFLGRMADYYQTSMAEIIRQAEHLRVCEADPHIVMAADVERSYQSVTEDPRLQSWNEPDDVLSVEAKRQVVRMYELLTGKTLLGSMTGTP